ncbi:DUF1622 domain-containing protein [Spirosoma linguale]|uniref:DUF1622 domain-containing protein n=1 Tax=Spirosoma linguale (strain ATCC 33905 / DSM 74 / LMG 10896 / Claus 1) TaxID=504472 RepID=D2QVQ5_SPILD|nr:hypothetical protein Slin_6942 [Spirosoma linguale DSM 74]
MPTNLFQYSLLATIVDFTGTLLIGLGASRALVRYLRARGVGGAVNGIQRSLAADLVTALSVKSGAGIIRTIVVADWTHFLLVLAIIGLRFFLGQTFSRTFPLNN